MLEQALKFCRNSGQEGQVLHLITMYADVFSDGEVDVGSTDLAMHCMSVDPGIVSIRQPPWRLGSEKE